MKNILHFFRVPQPQLWEIQIFLQPVIFLPDNEIFSVYCHAQQFREADQAAAADPAGDLPAPQRGRNNAEKNEDGIPDHAANIPTLAGRKELVTIKTRGGGTLGQ